MKKVIWSRTAIESLNRLVNFIDNKWEKKVADNLLDEIDNTILQIAQNPEMFQLFSKKKNIRRCVIKKRTLMFYRNSHSEIHILQFADVRQNPKKYKI